MRALGIVSAKGGVGKSAVTANLGAALHLQGVPVIAVDADVKLAGLGLQLGIAKPAVGIHDVLESPRSLLEALVIHHSGLRVLPAALPVREAALRRLPKLLQNRALASTLVLIDVPPGLEKNSRHVLAACHEALLVTTPEIPAVADVLKSVAAARAAKCAVRGVVVNRWKGREEELTPQEVGEACGLPVLAVIPEDRAIARGVFHRSPAVVREPKAPASRAFHQLAALVAKAR